MVKAAVAFDKALGELDTVVSEIPYEGERKKFAKALGEIILQINNSFIRPVVRQYPKLDPDPR
jgi:hypothetical protein